MDKAREISKFDVATANLFFIGENQSPYPVILLRHLEKGLLVKEAAKNNYILFTWDDISRIEIIANEKRFKGVFN